MSLGVLAIEGFHSLQTRGSDGNHLPPMTWTGTPVDRLQEREGVHCPQTCAIMTASANYTDHEGWARTSSLTTAARNLISNPSDADICARKALIYG